MFASLPRHDKAAALHLPHCKKWVGERGALEMDEATRRDRWGYEVRTASGACVDALDTYYEQVLAYGRDRAVILRSAAHDPSCVLANALAAHYVASKNPKEASRLLQLASVSLDNATSYERAVFGTISCLVSEDKDKELALDRHMEVRG